MPVLPCPHCNSPLNVPMTAIGAIDFCPMCLFTIRVIETPQPLVDDIDVPPEWEVPPADIDDDAFVAEVVEEPSEILPEIPPQSAASTRTYASVPQERGSGGVVGRNPDLGWADSRRRHHRCDHGTLDGRTRRSFIGPQSAPRHTSPRSKTCCVGSDGFEKRMPSGFFTKPLQPSRTCQGRPRTAAFGPANAGFTPRRFPAA